MLKLINRTSSVRNTLTKQFSTKAPNNNFFNLPFSSSLPSSNCLTYTETKVLNYNCKQIFDVVSDVTQYHRFLPFCQASPVHTKNFYKDQFGRELFILEADLKVGFLKFSETYTSTVTCYPNHLVRAENKDSKMFKTLTNEWKVEPYSHTEGEVKLSSEWSKLTFYINFEFNSILYTNLSKGYFNEISTKMMKSFENRCEEVYGNK